MKEMSKEERDFLLWRYFHQELTPTEQLSVQEQLSSDSDWQRAFLEIQAAEQQLQLLETEAPSLRFSQNVMESIAQASVARPARSYVSKLLVKSIGLGFVSIIAVCIAYAVMQIKWADGTDTYAAPFVLPNIRFNGDFINAGSWLYGCFAIVTVCFFVLADKFLYSKNRYETV